MLRKIKKAMLQSPIVLAAPVQTRLDKRPYSITLLSPKNDSLDTVQKVALGLLVVPALLAFISSLFSAQWGLFFITGFLLLLVGFIIWIIKLRAGMAWKVTWHEDMVEVEDGRYGPTEHWVEPLAAFTGLVQELARHSAKHKNEIGRPVYGLFLSHPDPFKSVLLHTDDNPITNNANIIAYYEEQLGKKFLKS
jgi:hypothetical protein